MDRRRFMALAAAPLVAGAAAPGSGTVVGRHRARSLGVRIGHMPTGPLNAITDVAGVEVGHATIVEGRGALQIGTGPVRTGVTAIWPQRSVIEEYLCCAVDTPAGRERGCLRG